jgi:inosine-uridine nucleoside N-ribohydrolase
MTQGGFMYVRKFLTLFAVVLVFSAIVSYAGIHELSAANTPLKVIVDHDGGVDDAAAIAWLLSQERYPVDVLGMTTVVGNTSVENAANNTLIILDKVDRQDISVFIGAATPLLQEVSASGSFIHGPDGLWFAGFSNPQDLSDLSTDVTGFYCQQAAPDVTLLALGPLTNLALALDVCPDAIAEFEQIVFLGGSIEGGNRTPVAEYNVWYDPEAADQVFTAGLNLILVPQEAFRTFNLTERDIDRLARKGSDVGQFLAGPLQLYGTAQTGFGGSANIVIADVAATIYTMNTALGNSQSALVKTASGILETDPQRLLRGQTVMGFGFASRITMIADDAEISYLAEQAFSDPNFNLEAALDAILMREPDNAQVVTDIQFRLMRNMFLQDLTN